MGQPRSAGPTKLDGLRKAPWKENVSCYGVVALGSCPADIFVLLIGKNNCKHSGHDQRVPETVVKKKGVMTYRETQRNRGREGHGLLLHTPPDMLPLLL